MDATHRFEVDPGVPAEVTDLGKGKEQEALLPVAAQEQPEPQLDPSSKLWNSRPDTSRWLAAHHVASADPVVRYRIQGWLAETGTSVWFGAGSTGKTQLMLWPRKYVSSEVAVSCHGG